MRELSPDDVYDLDRAHVFHSWSAQAAIAPPVLVDADGSWVTTGDGRRLLDFTSQLVYTNLGHRHPRIVDAIQRQAADLCTAAPTAAVEARSVAASMIAERAPESFEHVFFTNGGADANEHAIRMARLHTGRHKVLSTYRSYHGGTHLAVNVTGDPRRWASDSATAGTVHFFGPFLYRSEFHAATEAEECERALSHLEQVVAMEGPTTVAAIMLESIPGTAGVVVPPPGYLAGVKDLCARHGILLILDEVMAGFGRAASWFAFDRPEVGGGILPDLITFAKGVNSGYVPLGGVIISAPVYETFADRPYPGGLTYSGHPLACAAAVATMQAMEDERSLEHAEHLAKSVFGPGLAEIADRYEQVGEVRGLGVFWALDLVSDPVSRAPLAPTGGTSPQMSALVEACRAEGLLPFANSNRIHVVPPINISLPDAREGLAMLDRALAKTLN